jgi:flagellar hook protein FlgE
MSLFSALNTGVSGLNASSDNLSVIGDNIANADTTGFKSSRATFEEMFSQSLIGGAGTIGTGTRTGAVEKILTQGSLQNTGVPTDLALQGGGMFVVHGTHAGQTGTFFTRDGGFTVDRSGYLVNSAGLRVQGFPADAKGSINPSLNDLQVGNSVSAPQPTSSVTIKANLQADAPVLAGWDPANPATTSNFSTTVTVYDSLGQQHSTNVYFCKTADGAWDWHAMADGGGVSGGTAGTPSEIATGTLSFDANGAMTATTQTGSFTPAGATQPQALNFDFGSATSPGVTQFASTSEVSFLNQDGYGSGSLSDIQVGSDGVVTGVFSNGQTRALSQVAIASFSAADQLSRAGANLYSAAPGSGLPNIGTAQTGGRGSIVAGALEQSNVDISGQFVEMIAAQRNFQANSKTIQTADALLNELMQMKH